MLSVFLFSIEITTTTKKNSLLLQKYNVFVLLFIDQSHVSLMNNSPADDENIAGRAKKMLTL